ncbi:hypothetical protein WDU94_005904 [Cyamophila willieti]
MPRPQAYKYKYVCYLCKTYNTYIMCNLRMHIGSHFNVKPFVCQQCGFRVTRKQGLKYHMKTVHGLNH